MPSSQPDRATPGLRERKRARTRSAIQRHALELFASQGYAETSVEEIAAAADVSPSTFFRYYGTKGDVVLADFIDERVFVAMATAPPELDPMAALRWAVTSVFEAMSPTDLQLEVLRNELLRTVPDLRRGLLAELTRPVAKLAEATALRLDRDPHDPEIRMFAGAVIGAMALDPDQEPLGTNTVGERPAGSREQVTVPDVLARLHRMADVLPRLLAVPARGDRHDRTSADGSNQPVGSAMIRPPS